jgi:hypothetical protein
MKPTPESIYPDFLRSGLDRLQRSGLERDLLTLFAALEHFRGDLEGQEEPADILKVTHRYVAGLELCRTLAFYLVTPELSFQLNLCSPEDARPWLDTVVRAEMKTGRFAWALRQGAPLFFDAASPDGPIRAFFHPLTAGTQTLGMFCGVLQHGRTPSQEVAFSLLFTLLGTCSDAIAAARKTQALTREINTLTGLLPVCAWCKKVRDDRGYWDQLERYVTARTQTVFSHGICPDCAKNLKKTG